MILPREVLAQDSQTTIPKIPNISTLPAPYKDSNVTEMGHAIKDEFLPKIAMTVIKFAIPLSVLFIVVGAMQFLTAYGNTEKIGNAKNTVLFAVIGLVISLLSYAIVQLVFYTGYFGLST
ncbi:hypothetical protein KKD70_00120 [Patescibacteria group bacterium]|nr:hypothetical protein [Patescibacteria group bacterium]